jgi:hypothetical protein
MSSTTTKPATKKASSAAGVRETEVMNLAKSIQGP